MVLLVLFIVVYFICKLVIEIVVVIFLFVFYLVEIMLFIVFGIIHSYKGSKDIVVLICKKYSFLKIKIVIIYIFGVCYFFFCGLNIWKYIDFVVGLEKNIYYICVVNYIIIFV